MKLDYFIKFVFLKNLNRLMEFSSGLNKENN